MSDDKALTALQRRLGYTFSDSSLLQLALTHRSAGANHNERLEFLGDAVLGLCTADMLYRSLPGESEGTLSRQRAALVNRDTLSTLAIRLGLGELLVLGAGERKSGGRQRPSILCDAMEAVLGAIFIDGGLEACQASVERLFDPLGTSQQKDAKTRLQEIMQSRALPLPHYETVDVIGEEHSQVFIVTCRVPPLSEPTKGRGPSRRVAEQDAAARILQKLEKR
ncbi:MAG: ribonuclease III [Pseudomonadota bacterium]